MSNYSRNKRFDIFEIDASQAEDLEQLGSKPKFWFAHDGRRLMFKAENRGTGEDWAEVITGEIGVLGIPHVPYQLALDVSSGLPGVICENMAAKPRTLVLGNQLMLEADPNYPADDERRYGVREHTVESVARVVAQLDPPVCEGSWQPFDGCESSIDVFVGYVLLDTLVANQDRHHHNWGAIRNSTSCLAPTFDHGASLARNEPDEKRRRRLDSPNRITELTAFASRARSAFYHSPTDTRTLLSLDCFRLWYEHSPTAGDIWLERLARLTAEDFRRIIELVPESRMTPVAKEFTLQLILINQRRLAECHTPTN